MYQSRGSKLLKLIVLSVLVLVGVLIVIGYRNYIPPSFKGFLIDKREVFYQYYAYAFYMHIIAAPVALFSGVVQVVSAGYAKWKLHKLAGKIYLWAVLALAAPGGLVMAFKAIGGWPGTLNFMVLSSLWWVFTYKGWQLIKKGDTTAHKKWMYRSYVLAASAVFLRINSFVLYGLVEWDTTVAYLWASLLSWLPNWLLLELYFVRVNKKTPRLDAKKGRSVQN